GCRGLAVAAALATSRGWGLTPRSIDRDHVDGIATQNACRARQEIVEHCRNEDCVHLTMSDLHRRLLVVTSPESNLTIVSDERSPIHLVDRRAPRRVSTPILVVEDDPQLRLMFQLLLEGEGHRVVTAADGLEAVRCARTLRPSL